MKHHIAHSPYTCPCNNQKTTKDKRQQPTTIFVNAQRTSEHRPRLVFIESMHENSGTLRLRLEDVQFSESSFNGNEWNLAHTLLQKTRIQPLPRAGTFQMFTHLLIFKVHPNLTCLLRLLDIRKIRVTVGEFNVFLLEYLFV